MLEQQADTGVGIARRLAGVNEVGERLAEFFRKEALGRKFERGQVERIELLLGQENLKQLLCDGQVLEDLLEIEVVRPVGRRRVLLFWHGRSGVGQ